MGRLKDRLQGMGGVPSKDTEEEYVPSDLTPAPVEPIPEKPKVVEQIKTIHQLHKDIIENPLPKGICVEMIGGIPIDTNDLTDMSTYKTSPRFVTSMVDNITAKVRNDVLGYMKRKPLKFGKLIWVIIAALGILVIGYFLMSTDVSAMFKGVFGM